MPDAPEPPRQFYGFKPREFERANAPRPDAPSAPAQTPPPEDPSARIDIHELHRQAGTPGPVLSPGTKPVAENEVHAILRDNAASEKAAGLHEVAPLPPRRSRRKRDYAVVMLAANGLLAILATYAFRTSNVIMFVSSIAGIGMISAAITWVMWFIVDDY
ncbi:MAG TPA: hypothetical protein VHE61_14880 [Opitutaceae bacterium]|nr:hypothetical protein [Opitutaceae bacterium]